MASLCCAPVSADIAPWVDKLCASDQIRRGLQAGSTRILTGESKGVTLQMKSQDGLVLMKEIKDLRHAANDRQAVSVVGS